MRDENAENLLPVSSAEVCDMMRARKRRTMKAGHEFDFGTWCGMQFES